MKAITFEHFGGLEVLKLTELALPVPAPDEMLVKVHFAAVNPKDAMVRKGKLKLFTGSKFPQRLGHDWAGEVIELGSRVKSFQKGNPAFGMINSWKAGAYAQYICVKAEEAAKIPEGISYEDAAGVPLAALTALQALRDLGKIKAGDKVFINGASGGVGVFAVQIARYFGAEITAVCSGRNAELVKSLGADRVIDYTQENILEAGQSYDLFFDVFGNQAFKNVKPLLKKGGLYISTIPAPKIVRQVFATLLSSKKVKLVVVKSKAKDLDLLAKMLNEGKLKSVKDKIFILPEADQAHARIESKRTVGKILLDCHASS